MSFQSLCPSSHLTPPSGQTTDISAFLRPAEHRPDIDRQYLNRVLCRLSTRNKIRLLAQTVTKIVSRSPREGLLVRERHFGRRGWIRDDVGRRKGQVAQTYVGWGQCLNGPFAYRLNNFFLLMLSFFHSSSSSCHRAVKIRSHFFFLSMTEIRLLHYFGCGFPPPSHHRTVFPAASFLWEYLCAGYYIRRSYIRLRLYDLSISASPSARDGSTGHRFRSQKDS